MCISPFIIDLFVAYESLIFWQVIIKKKQKTDSYGIYETCFMLLLFVCFFF